MKTQPLFFFLFYFVVLTISAQALLSPRLSQQLTDNSLPDELKLVIYFKKQVNYDSLNTVFNEKNTPLPIRQKTVIRLAQKVAQTTKNNFYASFISGYKSQIKSIDYLWIVNMAKITLSKSAFIALTNHPDIALIEEFDRFYGKPVKPLNPIHNAKAVNGIEPGLAAINAPALWQMGYTGKARKIYSIDTGVWKDHPSIKSQFLGNYTPLVQAWNGIDAPYPVDKDGSHGTHTVGTELGLNKATNDTIGVAFNAYYMVADPIVTNIADIKPLVDYINTFQFALNPDGDTATTSDIPDVINNSWGIATHDDTTICAPSYVTDMFNAVQAAGIANIFSAGNEGPGDTTIGMPQYVVSGIVNTFTVGALDGNNNSFPIASFSSRGPTACPDTGSLAIKPEVAAPGVNVRSCVDTNNFAIYSGTSMAGPHVSGAALLLKEAFPNVTGEEILKALYFSAIDLGQPGEDNVYGMGMIDVLAAYNYLAAIYTPTPPMNNLYDIKIASVIQPKENYSCATSITPEIKVLNYGQTTVTDFTIEYALDNTAINTQTWTGNLASGQQTTILLNNISVTTTGLHELRIKVILDSSLYENDYIDNQRVVRFTTLPNSNLPFIENFEQGIDSTIWTIGNYDYNFTWDTAITSGIEWSNVSAIMPMADYNPKKEQTDQLISPVFTLPNNDSIYLSFTYAYNKVHDVIADTLKVWINPNCNNSFPLWIKGGDSLTTTLPQPQVNFVPDSSADWDTAYINLSAFKGQQIYINFESINLSGNNLYLDNIKIYQGNEPASVKTQLKTNIKIYPNPVAETLTLDFGKNINKNAQIAIYSSIGTLAFQNHIKTNRQNSINVSNFTPGIYFMQIRINQTIHYFKFLKQ